ncbi:hypothetical protein [Streptomyces griseochromogenes]|uniref:hypothetical protein n=1 Tax=Streptomyces griseochromogenes TaxID=68214 RepID=UPI0037A0366E
MPDKDVEQTDERGHIPGPWWADRGTWGAVTLIVFGGLAAAWVFFRLPGTPEEPASGYYGASKVIAIGLVTVGCTLLGRRRTRGAAVEETKNGNAPDATGR